jgi:hypothetical protein
MPSRVGIAINFIIISQILLIQWARTVQTDYNEARLYTEVQPVLANFYHNV